jgi:hypothetical protein
MAYNAKNSFKDCQDQLDACLVYAKKHNLSGEFPARIHLDKSLLAQRFGDHAVAVKELARAEKALSTPSNSTTDTKIDVLSNLILIYESAGVSKKVTRYRDELIKTRQESQAGKK